MNNNPPLYKKQILHTALISSLALFTASCGGESFQDPNPAPEVTNPAPEVTNPEPEVTIPAPETASHAFNSNNLPSDVEGDIPASVLFVQHSVIPSINKVEGDIQPHLIAQRKTMVLFKPKAALLKGPPAPKLIALSADNKKVSEILMKHPNELTKIAGSYDVKKPWQYDKIITTQAELNSTNLTTLISSNNTIMVRLNEETSLENISIPDGASFKNKILTIVSSSNKISINYSGQKTEISNKQTLVLKNIDGKWTDKEANGLAEISYGHGFWSAVLPSNAINPGMKLRFEHGANSSTMNDVKVGAPTELLIHTIDIGMLTPNRNKFSFQENEEYHRQYFQRLPASRLIVTQYEALHLTEVMLPDGSLLTDNDPSEGGWHTGTMRGVIAKNLISHGINNANYGKNSSLNQERGHPFSVAQLTAHNSIGTYANGVQIHGGSGGAGIVTLDRSIGNEFSHEVGHNFLLNHYPKKFFGSVIKSADKPNSTWGWDSDKNEFIPNFAASVTNQSMCYLDSCEAPFHGRQFGKDPMAGGFPMHNNEFTLHGPYTAWKSQKFLENKAIFDNNSTTGFSKWNDTTKTMEPWTNKIENIHITRKDASVKQVTEAELDALLNQYVIVDISFWDGNWTKNIHVPAAEKHNNKLITVNHHASIGSDLHINGKIIQLVKGSTAIYQSDGNQWKELDNIPLALKVPKKPLKQGVVVTTLVGFYDPEQTLNSYIYPALHGSYGNVYPADKPNESSLCYASVDTATEELRFNLHPKRLVEKEMNKFHINIDSTIDPKNVSIICDGNMLTTKAIKKVMQTLKTSIIQN